MATIIGTQGPDTIRTGAENDEIDGRGGNDQLRGAAGDDLIHGRKGDDQIFGESGDDRLHGGLGTDLLFGDTGKDRLWGDRGDDELHGEDGDDILLGREDDDILFGDREDAGEFSGNDVLIGGLGNDTLHASEGRDTMIGNHGEDVFRFDFSTDTQLSDDPRMNGVSTTIEDFVRGPDTLVMTLRTNELLNGVGPEIVNFHRVTFDDLDSDNSGQIDDLDDATTSENGVLTINVSDLVETVDGGSFSGAFGGTITMVGVTELRPVDFSA